MLIIDILIIVNMTLWIQSHCSNYTNSTIYFIIK